MPLSTDNVVDAIVLGSLGYVWWDYRKIKSDLARCMTKESHDEVCKLKLDPIKSDLAEIKSDLKTLLARYTG